MMPSDFGQLPVRLRGEVELALRAVLGDDDVAALIRRDRDMLQRDVRHLQHQALQLGVDRLHLFVEFADAVAELAHARDQRLPLRGVLGATDFLRALVQLGLERLDLSQQRAAALVERQDLVDRRLRVRGRDRGFDALRVLPDQSQVEHCGSFECRGHASPGTQERPARAGRCIGIPFPRRTEVSAPRDSPLARSTPRPRSA